MFWNYWYLCFLNCITLYRGKCFSDDMDIGRLRRAWNNENFGDLWERYATVHKSFNVEFELLEFRNMRSVLKLDNTGIRISVSKSVYYFTHFVRT